jgi:hypothetical protein
MASLYKGDVTQAFWNALNSSLRTLMRDERQAVGNLQCQGRLVPLVDDTLQHFLSGKDIYH